MKFLRNVFATIIGMFLFVFISFFMLIIFGSALSSSTMMNEYKAKIRDNSVLKLDLSNVSSDYGGTYIFDEIQYKQTDRSGLVDVLYAIDYAKKDSRIKGISIENNSSGLGIAQKQELRSKLDEFKKSGKFVLSYANNYTQSDYYLNSIADTIYLNPLGSVDFKGLSTEVLYMKDLQTKTGVKMEVIRHGKYKSAVEPFLQQEMSDANREQNFELLQSIWESISSDISKSRNIPLDQLNNIATNLLARNANLALENRLIDKIAYIDEYQNAIKHSVKIHKNKEIRQVNVLDYVKNIKGVNKKTAKELIAVIFAQGEIKSGEGSPSVIGEGAINRALKEARTNSSVKAIVLRVDSPGGSALTSDIIWREIELTKKIKPVIVSMGNVAASGGYYIASNANYIFAEPTTVTGSIGVFGVLPNAEKLVNEWGVKAHRVKTHKNASNYSPFKSIDETMRVNIKESIEQVYDVFLTRVADGRKITKEQVHEIAQGRIWTGAKAKEIGLVDGLGGLQDALAYTANLVKLEDYKVSLYPDFRINLKDFVKDLVGISSSAIKEDIIKNELGEANYQLIKSINYLKQAEGIQALMPVQYNIQ